jgi:hypothetical protein
MLLLSFLGPKSVGSLTEHYRLMSHAKNNAWNGLSPGLGLDDRVSQAKAHYPEEWNFSQGCY